MTYTSGQREARQPAKPIIRQPISIFMPSNHASRVALDERS
jgi:hypothetical protein